MGDQATAILCVAAGGAIGSVARLLIASWCAARFGTAYPWGTFVINLTGSFAIGVVLQLTARADASPYARLFAATGVLGGYTTFSSFAYETSALAGAGRLAPALLYAGGSVALGTAAAAAGAFAARLLSAR